jgi:hypothetical protein
MVAVTVAAAAACGGSSTPALDAEVGADSWRFELTTTTAPEDPNEVRVAGVFDRKRRLGRMTVEAPREDLWHYTTCERDSDPHFPEEERVVDGHGYSRWLAWGKSYWLSEEVSPSSTTVDYTDALEMIAPFPIGVLRPTDVLAQMRRYSDGVETLGTEQVRGHETMHFRAKVDLRRFFVRSREWERPAPWVLNRAEQVQAPLVVDAWIDSADRARRMALALNVEQGGRLGDVLSYLLELFDFGVPVSVAEPSAVVTREQFYEAAEEGWPVDDAECEEIPYPAPGETS